MSRQYDAYRPEYSRRDSTSYDRPTRGRSPERTQTSPREQPHGATTPSRHRSSMRLEQPPDSRASMARNEPRARSQDQPRQRESMSFQDAPTKSSKSASFTEDHAQTESKTPDPRRRLNAKSHQHTRSLPAMGDSDHIQEPDLAVIFKDAVIAVSRSTAEQNKLQDLQDQLTRVTHTRDVAEKKAPHSAYAKQLGDRARQTEMKLKIGRNQLTQSQVFETEEVERMKRTIAVTAQKPLRQQQQCFDEQIKKVEDRHNSEMRNLQEKMQKQEDDLINLREVIQSRNGSTDKEITISKQNFDEIHEQIQGFKILESLIQSHQEQLKAQEQDICALRTATKQEVDPVISRVKDAEDRLEAISRSKYISTSELDRYIRMFNKHREEFDKFETETKDSLHKLSTEKQPQPDESAKQRLDALDARTIAQTAVLQDMKGKIDGYALAITSLNSRFNNMTTEPIVRSMATVLDSRATVLREEVRKIHVKLASMTQKFVTVEASYDRLSKDLFEHRTHTSNSVQGLETVKQVDAKITEMQKKVDDLANRLYQSVEEQGNFKTWRTECQQSLANITKDMAEITEITRTARSDLTELDKRYEGLQMRNTQSVTETEQKLRGYTDEQLSTLRAYIENGKHTSKNVRQEVLDELANNEGRHKKLHTALEMNIGSIQSGFEEAKETFEQRVSSAEEKIAHLEKQQKSVSLKLQSRTALASTSPSIIQAFGHHNQSVTKEGNQDDTIEITTLRNKNAGGSTLAKSAPTKRTAIDQESASPKPLRQLNYNSKQASHVKQTNKSAVSRNDEISESDQAEDSSGNGNGNGNGDSHKLLERFGARQKPASRKITSKVSNPANTAKKSSSLSSRGTIEQPPAVQNGLKRKREVSRVSVEEFINVDDSETETDPPLVKSVRKQARE